jgi:hypothetical protein
VDFLGVFVFHIDNELIVTADFFLRLLALASLVRIADLTRPLGFHSLNGPVLQNRLFSLCQLWHLRVPTVALNVWYHALVHGLSVLILDLLVELLHIVLLALLLRELGFCHIFSFFLFFSLVLCGLVFRVFLSLLVVLFQVFDEIADCNMSGFRLNIGLLKQNFDTRSLLVTVVLRDDGPRVDCVAHSLQ